jgi:hypothetical protein
MPFTALTPVTSAAAGAAIVAPVAVDATNGNSFVNTGREMVEITNGGGSSITVTIVTNGTFNVNGVQYAVADVTVTIAAGASKVCGPFDKGLFNDPTTGAVQMTWSSGTSVTARVISLGTG